MRAGRSTPVIRRIRIGEQRSSLRLEPGTWHALADIAARQARSVDDLVAEIDRGRTVPNLTTAVRMYVVGFYRPAGNGRDSVPLSKLREQSGPLPRLVHENT